VPSVRCFQQVEAAAVTELRYRYHGKMLQDYAMTKATADFCSDRIMI